MIGGLLDSLMGKVDYQARAPRIDTKPGQQAIQTQAQMGGDQALAQAYSLAASGRGGGASSALAFREAQRRGAEATANLQGQAVAQQQALQQAANQQQAQAEMQAQQINAGIAQNNAQGLQRLAGAAMSAGALMFSDSRQKEMLMPSDFTAKEPPGRFANVETPMPEYARPVAQDFPVDQGVRPAPARAGLPEYRPSPGPPASAGAAAFGLNRPRVTLPSLYDAARARNMADPNYSPPAAYIPQQVRAGVPQDAFTNRAVNKALEENRAFQSQRDRNLIAEAYGASGARGVESLTGGAYGEEAGAAAARYVDAQKREAAARGIRDWQTWAPSVSLQDEYDAAVGNEPVPQMAYRHLGSGRAEALPYESAPGDWLSQGQILDRFEGDRLEAQLADRRRRAMMLLGENLTESDFTSKELMKARVGRGRVFDTSPERIDRMGRFEVEAARERMREAERKRKAGEVWRYRSDSARNIDDQTRGNYGPLAPMSSDFRQKEDLDPVQPTLYRYTPESSYRQALEAAQRTYEDKRAPRMGIIAQDLQRSPAFAPSVVEQPSGQLAIDRDRALSTALAELGGLNKRLAKLEGGKKRGA